MKEIEREGENERENERDRKIYNFANHTIKLFLTHNGLKRTKLFYIQGS